MASMRGMRTMCRSPLAGPAVLGAFGALILALAAQRLAATRTYVHHPRGPATAAPTAQVVGTRDRERQPAQQHESRSEVWFDWAAVRRVMPPGLPGEGFRLFEVRRAGFVKRLVWNPWQPRARNESQTRLLACRLSGMLFWPRLTAAVSIRHRWQLAGRTHCVCSWLICPPGSPGGRRPPEPATWGATGSR